MVCKKCNNRIKKNTTICPHCGAYQTESVSLGAIGGVSNPPPKRFRTVLKVIGTILLSLLSVILALGVAGYCYIYTLVDDNIQHGVSLNPSELNINEELPPEEDVINIALFGLDNRDSDTDGHSDAIIIVSIDRVHNKIKMTSIARDTLVKVNGYWSENQLTKITHAFSYGSQKKDQTGVGVAVRTLNQNFGMNISRYAYVSFPGFVDIIDYLGGVTINVEQREIKELNTNIQVLNRVLGKKEPYIKKAGVQRLSGVQALGYSRIRKIDSDIKRGNRQKAVLEAVFNEMKTQPISRFPNVIAACLNICHTNLSSNEILNLGTWAVTSSPTVEHFSLPNDSCKAWGGTPAANPEYGWVWVMDLRYATALLHDFIYETNNSATMTPRRFNNGATYPIY